ncbi:MAG: radical SAM/SPASM domain-containing protein [Chloroflexi bacterium RBG_16_50_11]|nr:MAG: radical SAM/SPASM domain-containing protein [Chloroflexi bacterium RBG_16_50_11]
MSESDHQLYACLWELTLRCNLNCMHCGSAAGKARNKELSLDECYHIANQLLELGCKELTFIGGEIFLYPGWEKIARYMSDNGLIVNIMSNGYQIGEREIEQIKYAKLSNVGISIDGMETSHNMIRRRSDSFASIKKTFDLLNREQIPIGAVTCLLDFNFFELEELYAYLLNNNVELWQLQLANPMGNLADKRELILHPDKIPLITKFIHEKNKERRMLVVAADSIGYHDENETYIRGNRAPICFWEGCQAGLTSIFIDSIGNVKGCGALYSEVFIEGNLKEKTLREIWDNQDNFSYNRKFDVNLLTGKCNLCDMGNICKGGCRASNYFTTHSLYENAFCARNNPA